MDSVAIRPGIPVTKKLNDIYKNETLDFPLKNVDCSKKICA